MKHFKFAIRGKFVSFVTLAGLLVCTVSGNPQIDSSATTTDKAKTWKYPTIKISDAFTKDSLSNTPIFTSSDGEKGKFLVTDSSKYREIHIYCDADYPLVWKYEGVTEFSFENYGSGQKTKQSRNSKGDLENTDYYFEFLQFRLSEVYTGKYICYNKEYPERRSEVYIYFPGKNLMVNPRGKNMYLSEIKNSSDEVTIPCAVSRPTGIDVTLHKSNENVTELMELKNVKYDPMTGFRLTPKDTAGGLEGKYFCRARRGEIVTVAEFDLIKEAEDSKRCRLSCEENASCQIRRRGTESCRCADKFDLVTLDPLFFQCVKGCKSDGNCPENMACEKERVKASVFDSFDSTDKICKNPCLHTKDGIDCKGTCKVVGRKAVCS